MANETNVTLWDVRFSYVHLTKPYAQQPGQDEKYSATILVPKTDVAGKAAIDAAIEAATRRGVAERWGGQRPPIVPNPVYDGDGVRPSDGMPFGAECKGHWVFTASSKVDRPVEIVDANRQPIISPSEIYSGMYGAVNVTFYPYMFGGKKGIGCALGPVMKSRDGEPLGGGSVTAASAFSAAPDTAAAAFGQAQASQWQASQQQAQQWQAQAPQQQASQWMPVPGGVDPFSGFPV